MYKGRESAEHGQGQATELERQRMGGSETDKRGGGREAKNPRWGYLLGKLRRRQRERETWEDRD